MFIQSLWPGSYVQAIFTGKNLTIKVPIITASNYNYYLFYFSEKTRFDVSCEMIHMKYQD